MSKRWVLSSVACVLILVCSLSADAAWAGTKGKVKKGTYTSPEGNFSVAIPAGLGLRVNDGYDPKEGIGAVSFHDDLGNQTGIHFMRIPADVRNVFDEPTTRRQALEGFLEKAALPTWFLHVSKDTRILQQEFIQLNSVDAFIGLVGIPGGATFSIQSEQGMKRADSTRGVLTLYHDGYAYLLTTEVGGGVFGLSAEAPSREKQLATAREALTKFYATIQFRPPRR